MILSSPSTKVMEMACSYDGKYIFTAGGEDCTINMWTVNTECVTCSVCMFPA